MRKQSMTVARPVLEEEFFSHEEKSSTGTKASLAMIAAKQVLVSYPWGELKFKDWETEYTWRTCVLMPCCPLGLALSHECWRQDFGRFCHIRHNYRSRTAHAHTRTQNAHELIVLG